MSEAPFRLNRVLTHDADVRGVSAHPLSLHGILTASRDKMAKLWDSKDGLEYEPTRSFVGHSDFVYKAIYISGEKPLVLTCSQDNTAILWDIDTAQPVSVLQKHTGPVCCCDYSVLTSAIVTGSFDHTAIIWNIHGGVPTNVLTGHTNSVLCVKWLSNGQLLTGSGDRSILLWDNYQKIRSFNGHTDAVRGLAEVHGPLIGIGFLSCSNDTRIILWSLNGEQLQILAGHTHLVYCIIIVSPSEYVSGSEDKTMRVWRYGRCVQIIPHPATIWDVCALSNGDVVSACTDGIARIWTRQVRVNVLENDAPIMDLQEVNGKMYEYVFDVALNGDGRRMFKLGYNRGENPYIAAQRFIWENSDHGIWQHFLGEIANFITGSFNLGTSTYYDGQTLWVARTETHTTFHNMPIFTSTSSIHKKKSAKVVPIIDPTTNEEIVIPCTEIVIPWVGPTVAPNLINF